METDVFRVWMQCRISEEIGRDVPALFTADDCPLIFDGLMSWEPLELDSFKYNLGARPLQDKWLSEFMYGVMLWRETMPSGLTPGVYIYLCAALECLSPVLDAIYYNAPQHRTGYIPPHFFVRLEKAFDADLYYLWQEEAFRTSVTHLLKEEPKDRKTILPCLFKETTLLEFTQNAIWVETEQ